MSNFPGYKTKAFSPSQKFFVLDPNTGSPSFVQGSDLVSQLTPNSNYVYAESTRTNAQATDYALGSVIQTGGATSVGDNLAGVYLVVPSGEGDFPMDNGNELLVLAGDDTLREQLALNTTGNGSDLIAHTGTSDTVTEALDKRTIYVGSVAELEGVPDRSGGQQVNVSADRLFEFSSADLSTEVAADTKQVFYVAPSGEDGSNGAWVWIGKRQSIPVEWAGGVAGDTSAGARTANEEALAAIEAFNYQPAFSPDLTYYVSDGYDAWQHRFVAGRNCALFVGAVSHDISNAFWGLYRIDDFGAGQNEYVTLRNARDNIVIARMARGDQSAASHVFQLPLDIRRDSHSLISQAGTAGGSCDLLFRDSGNNDKFYIVNDTTNKNLDFLFNTTVPPAFNFDVAMRIPTEVSGNAGFLEFVALPVKTAVQEYVNERSVLGRPAPPGGNRAVGITKTNADLPYINDFIRSSGAATNWHASGVLEVSFLSNTGVYGRRRQYFEWNYDGSTSTQSKTDEVNTLPASVTAAVTISAGDRYAFTLDFDDTAGDGTDCVISAKVDFSYSAI